MWLGIAAYLSFGTSKTVLQSCCVGEQASNPLAFKVELFSYKGVNVSFIYGLDGQPTRIALNRDFCIRDEKRNLKL
jgi:hypothetical protein